MRTTKTNNARPSPNNRLAHIGGYGYAVTEQWLSIISSSPVNSSLFRIKPLFDTCAIVYAARVEIRNFAEREEPGDSASGQTDGQVSVASRSARDAGMKA
jgi:inosine-uridine nucleoside N-ribohydrolase